MRIGYILLTAERHGFGAVIKDWKNRQINWITWAVVPKREGKLGICFLAIKDNLNPPKVYLRLCKWETDSDAIRAYIAGDYA